MLLSNNKTGTSVNSYTGQGVQPVVQAQLAANLNSKTFVLGNTNVVSDTLGTGNWKFYVAPTTSIASITSASASTEWTGGSLLPYALPLTLPTDTAIWSPFTTTVYDSVGNYSGTLVNGATIAVDGNSRVAGQGYLSLTNSSTTTPGTYFKFTPFGVVNTGLSFSFWGKFSTSTPYGGLGGGRIFDIRDAGGREISLQRGGDTLEFYFYVSEAGVIFNTPNIIDDVWRHFAITIEYSGTGGATSTYKFYVNGSLISTVPNKAYPSLGFRNYYNISTYADTGTYGMVGGIDDFQIFNRAITATEVNTIYTQPEIYYPLNVADINPTNASQVGDLASDTYSYNSTLYGGATIAIDANSRIAGQGYLKLVATSSQYLQLPSIQIGSSGISFGFWFYSNSSGNFARIIEFTTSTAGGENILCGIYNGGLSFTVRKAGINTDALGLFAPTNNQWYHVVWTMNSDRTWRIYINGTSIYNVVRVYPNTVLRTTNYLGKSTYGPDAYFNGGIDDFRFYNRVLTQSDVDVLYANTLPALPTNMIVSYNFNAVGIHSVILANGATIATDNSPGPGQGYLSLTAASSHHAILPSITFSSNTGLTFACWFRSNGTGTYGRLMDLGSYYPDISNNIIFFISGNDVCVNVRLNNSGTTYQTVTTGINFNDNVWRHVVWTISPTGIWNVYVNGAINVSNYTGVYPLLTTRTSNFIGKSNWLPIGDPYFNGGIDDFRYYNRAITADEVSLIYSQASIYYPFNVADINTSVATQVGEYSTGSYVYNGTLVNGATIAVDGNSRVSGQGYLSLLSSTTQYVNLTSSISTGANGLSFSFWYRLNATLNNQRFFCFSNGFQTQEIMMGVHAGNAKFIINANTTDTPILSTIYNNNTWNHVVWTITPTSTTSTWRIYLNGVLTETLLEKQYPPVLSKRTNNWIGRAWYTGSADANYNGGIDDFRFYNRVITDNEATAIYVDQRPSSLKDTVTGATWMPTSAIPVDASETSYTVKSTEIALTPGTNSTYAIWTAPKTTNLKIDVSFADYHSRSAGVGFQMFKIDADNTFGSVIFPRTVTSTALTNAASTNYLSVPSRTLSVSQGDKIFYRIDANGNTTAASSVLATNIYTDSNYVPVPNSTNINEIKVTQAQLATNLNSATLVSGNVNTVLDTVGTGNWKFYVAPTTSIEAITSASASTEWTGGSILPYAFLSTVPTDMALHFTFNTNAVLGTTVSSTVGGYTGTLVNGATIATNGSPAPGSGYLSLTKASGQYINFAPFNILANGITVTTWFRATSNNSYGRIYDLRLAGATSEFSLNVTSPSGIGLNGSPSPVYTTNVCDNVWRHLAITVQYAGVGGASSIYKIYINGVLQTLFNSQTFLTAGYPSTESRPICNIGTSDNIGSANYIGAFDGGIDDFRIYQRTITAEEVSLIYSQASIYYPFELADISLSAPTKIGDLATGSYVYNGTLVATSPNIATIAVDANSRVSGKGYLSLTRTNAYFKFAPFNVLNTGLSFAFWGRFAPSTIDGGRIFDMRDPEISLQRIGGGLFKLYVTGPNDVFNSPTGMFDDVWRHFAVTIAYGGASGATSAYTLYINGSVSRSATKQYPALGARNYYNIGSNSDTNNAYGIDGGMDDFRVYQRPISAFEVSALYAGTQPSALKDTVTGATWMPTSATTVDDNETSYTVKSNEIALKPGTNSTYAIWTSPKTTNIRVDVSFADYHTRSNGVGFQMFKINSDNTFGSTIFPRTVTSAVLTDSSANYLSVPSTSLSVVAGDKLVYRIDGNGNPTSSSSVLATNIYADPNYVSVPGSTNVNETKVTQAQLATNLNSTTFVSGNANIVYDTVGTSNWKFYVAGNTSIGSISSASNSSEWTVGNLLSYDAGPIISSYSFDTTTQSGSTIKNTTTNVFDLTLNGASIATVDPSPYSSLNSGYLSMNVSSGQCAISTTPVSFSRPFSISLWVKCSGTYPSDVGAIGPPLFEIGNSSGTFIFMNSGNFSTNIGTFYFYTNGAYTGGIYYRPDSGDATVWNHYVLTFNSSNNTVSTYKNGSLYTTGTINWTAPASFTYLNFGKSNVITNPTTGSWTPRIDKFRIFKTSLSASDVAALYTETYVPPPPTIKDATTGAAWLTAQATPLDPSETSYTVKSNEIALIPGTNSTYAIWTAPKTTNLKIDVSFADYHSQSANGVGFQMFKINADNSFGSVIFPRTVTGNALTNAAPTNYLSVPSVNISVVTGDKVVYRIDGNGNPTSSSSVLATNIYSYSGIWN